MDNHVMFGRGARFLRVIISGSRTLPCLPSVKMQKHLNFFRSMSKKAIMGFGFSEIQNN